MKAAEAEEAENQAQEDKLTNERPEQEENALLS